MTLSQELRDLIGDKKTVLLGIGNPDRGDDGLGPALIDRLQGLSGVTCIKCDDMPENYTDVIREAQPEMILMIDAVDFGGQSGEVILIQSNALPQRDRFTTHHASLTVVMNYLQHATGAQVWLLGVQPQSTQEGGGLSPEIEQVLDQLAFVFRNIADEEEC